MTKVKICGLTSVDDARIALNAGADFVGFVVDVPVQTPRKISLTQAAGILQEIESRRAIIVLMPSTLRQVEDAVELKPFGIQFHGNETPRLLEQAKDIESKVKLIKTLHIRRSSTFKDMEREAESYLKVADYLLFDTQTRKVGGTGETHDWNLARSLVERLEKPVFLSGGLNPGNVRQAVSLVKPFGVDASSGLESTPGFKDAGKIRYFMSEVRECST